MIDFTTVGRCSAIGIVATWSAPSGNFRTPVSLRSSPVVPLTGFCLSCGNFPRPSGPRSKSLATTTGTASGAILAASGSQSAPTIPAWKTTCKNRKSAGLSSMPTGCSTRNPGLPTGSLPPYSPPPAQPPLVGILNPANRSGVPRRDTRAMAIIGISTGTAVSIWNTTTFALTSSRTAYENSPG